MAIPRYHSYQSPSGCGFTAALYTADRRDGQLVELHDHDFYEMMYITEGEVVHQINGREETTLAGDLWFIRPEDVHAMYKRTKRGPLAWVNVEFSIDAWTHFAEGAGPPRQQDGQARLEPTGDVGFPRRLSARLGVDERDECARVFQRVLNRYFQSPRRLDLYRFLSAAVGYLDPVEYEEEEALRNMPPWLAQVCREMNHLSNLQIGLPRMTEIGNVSFAHLARTLKAHTGRTPTEFINRLRLKNASMLLTTTSREISDVAFDCGFENLSYFYRLFRREYGQTPHRHRIEARRQTAL